MNSPARKLRWTVDPATGYRNSTCGRYRVWLNGRPLDGTKEWGAALVTPDGTGKDEDGGCTWLTYLSETCGDAKATCQEHADKGHTDADNL